MRAVRRVAAAFHYPGCGSDFLHRDATISPKDKGLNHSITDLSEV
jgi:hypothetical protein